MERTRALILLVSLAALVIAGCGGGGGGGGSVTPLATGSTVRQLQPGDTLTYNVLGTTRAPVSGTATVTTRYASIQPYSTMRLLEVTTLLDLRVGEEQVQSAVLDYLAQTAVGGLIKIGSITDEVSHFGVGFSTDPVHCPSPVAVDTTWSYQTTFDGGAAEDTVCSITALEPVNGRMAYKIVTSVIGAAGQALREDWLVPDLGYPVRMIWTQPVAGQRVDLTADLASKSF